MERKVAIYIALFLLTTALLSVSYCDEANIKVLVDGNQVVFTDAQPMVNDDNRTIIPVRAVTEALGAEVGWDAEKQWVTVERDGTVLGLRIDQAEVDVNGETKTMDTKVTIHDSRTYVPVRFVSEFLGLEVEWDGDNRAVLIYDETEPTQEEAVVAEAVAKDGTKIVEGYEIKLETDMGYGYTSERVEMSFTVDMMDVSWPFQMSDIKDAIESKYGLKTAFEVYMHITQKEERFDVLESKKNIR